MICSNRVGIRLRSLGAIAVLVAASGCGGNFSTPNGPVVGTPGHGGPPPTKLVDVKVTVTIPPRGGARPNYLSYNTQSLSIVLLSVGGSGVTGVNPTIMNTLPKSHDCKGNAQETLCTSTAKGSPGEDVFSVTAYDGPGATGKVLSVGTIEAKISGDNGNLGISNRVPLTLGGVIASLKLSLVPNKGKRGQRATVAVTLDAYDASRALIVGPSAYSQPIALAVQGDTDNAFRLHDGKRSGETLSIAKPASGLTMTYDGDTQAGSVSVAADVDGPSSISASASFPLTGKQPPPPVGTIYALNLGSGGGQGATITEYDGKSEGNASPTRTLSLDKQLYAVSLAVDSAGNIYVGYFDNSLGYNPATGAPDTGNEIAIYAATASGGDQPSAVLTASPSSSTALFPIFIAFDPTGRLVTYGATTVDKNGGDAVLLYAAGSSGQATPEDAFAFNSPTIHYSGPTGLSVDSAGNVYTNGTFKLGFSNAYGMYTASADDIGNPGASPSRIIPWDAKTKLNAGETTDVALNNSGEIFIANVVKNGSGNGTTCQAAVNVYAAGAQSGSTDNAPLRTLTLDGIKAAGTECTDTFNPLLFYFPEIQIYGGSTLFAVDTFNDAIDEFASTGQGVVKPALRIAGSATRLDGPVALAITSVSGSATAGPVTGARAPERFPFKHQNAR
ncbi:MAG TPA: hypothetical protein VGG51_14360 [Candidatus Cybelea sp.]|jgi:hypothetical protein